MPLIIVLLIKMLGYELSNVSNYGQPFKLHYSAGRQNLVVQKKAQGLSNTLGCGASYNYLFLGFSGKITEQTAISSLL